MNPLNLSRLNLCRVGHHPGGESGSSIKNKRALVTGASRGLGYATALALAREGCRVAINSRNKDKLDTAVEKITRETGALVFGVTGDVGEVESCP